jgi:phosphoenolpyruvate carboxykinase (ATP)
MKSDPSDWIGSGHVRNASTDELCRQAVANGEGRLAAGGALVVNTGRHTGRSPDDKFVVEDETTSSSVWWDNNRAMTRRHFQTLVEDMLAMARIERLHVQDLFAGADLAYRLKVRVACQYAWHALFIRHLMIRPAAGELSGFTPELMIIDLPRFRADPQRHGVRSETVIALDLMRGLVLIGGTAYAGEMKKSVFSSLSYRLPERGVMPMHCAANQGRGGNVALIFGLSGTGKTTLSADPARALIGDDEHGWSPAGIFNFEGGCYAKVIRLSADAEPQIHAAAQRACAVLENVVVDPRTGRVDFADGSLTENTRAAYPIDFIANASAEGRGGHPRDVVMLAADAFGVLPPIARLSPAQAIYHFLSGYTARIAGTEQGVKEPEATFSACFGAPFMPLHPGEYGRLLGRLLARHKSRCWLINTGWTGGGYGIGRRMPISATRALLAAALEGHLDKAPMRVDPWFGVEVPTGVPGIDSSLLDPRRTWPDAAAYDREAARLIAMFRSNFERFESGVDAAVRAAGPVRTSV